MIPLKDPLLGFTHPEVIIVGQEASKNARPKRAGLTGLLPKPPKTCFPTAIAKAAPKTGIHQGAPAFIL